MQTSTNGQYGYVKGSELAKIDGKPVLNVGHNSYIYGKSGKRLKRYRGSRKNTFVYLRLQGKYVLIENVNLKTLPRQELRYIEIKNMLTPYIVSFPK